MAEIQSKVKCMKNAPEQLLRGIEQFYGGAGRSRTDLHGFAIRCITALLPRHLGCKKGKLMLPFLFGRNAISSGCLERDKRLELSTYTLARYRSTN